MTARRSTFVPSVPSPDRIEEAARLYSSAVALADANELEQVMFR